MAENIAERLDALLDELPQEAVSVSLDAGADWKVCTIVIDWRLVPDDLLPTGERRLRLIKEDTSAR